MKNMVLDTKVIRGRLKMSQAEFASIPHVDQSSVSLWETDRNAPSRAATALIQQYCVMHACELAWKPAPERAEAAE